MAEKTIGLWFDRWANYRFEGEGLRSGSLFRLFRKAVWFKANPRDRDYMQALFAERFPAGRFIEIQNADEGAQVVAQADTVVLLYPDAIGLGFYAVDRAVRRALAPHSEWLILNGRRRQFAMNRRRYRQLLRRRFLEQTMLGELVFLALFCLATPPFLIADLVRGRR